MLARELAGISTATAERRADIYARVNQLFAAEQDLVYATCYRYVGQPEWARELAQDSLLLAWQKLSSFRGEARFRTWLVGIARYQCLNAIRKKADLLTEDGLVEVSDSSGSVLGALRRQEREGLLRDAAAAVLDETEQEAVWLRYGEHLPLAQIGEVLGLESSSGARGVLQRCKRRLSRELRRRLEELGHGMSLVRESRDP